MEGPIRERGGFARHLGEGGSDPLPVEEKEINQGVYVELYLSAGPLVIEGKMLREADEALAKDPKRMEYGAMEPEVTWEQATLKPKRG